MCPLNRRPNEEDSPRLGPRPPVVYDMFPHNSFADVFLAYCDRWIPASVKGLEPDQVDR